MAGSMGRKVGWSVGLASLLIAGLLGVLFLINQDPSGSSLPGGEEPGQEVVSGDPEGASGAGAGSSDAGSGEATTPAGDEEPESESESEVEEKPDGPPSITGIVRSLEGDPVEGARIYLVGAKQWSSFVESLQGEMQSANRDPGQFIRGMRQRFVDESRKLTQTESDPEGRYAFYGQEAGEFRLIVLHAEHLPSIDNYVIREEGQIATLDLTLIPGHAIEGMIVDAEGKPVAGATVTAVASDSSGSKGFGKMLSFMMELFDGKIIARMGSETSDEEGKFRVSSLEPVLYDLTVVKPGYSPKLVTRVGAGTNALIISLDEGRFIRGLVVDPSGQPVEGAEVRLRSFTPREAFNNPVTMSQADFDILGEKSQDFTTGAGGQFAFTGLDDGQYALTVDTESYPDFLQEGFRVEAPGLDLGTIALQEGESITGRVLDEDGVAIEGAEVVAETPQKGGRNAMNFNGMPARSLGEATSDESGEFTLQGLLPGEVQVVVRARGFARKTVTGVETGTTDLEIRLSGGGSIFGQVVDAETGEPVVGMRFMVAGPTPDPSLSDEEGYFEITGLPVGDAAQPSPWGPGKAYLIGTHKGYTQISQQVDIDKSSPEKPLVLKTRALGHLEGVVIDTEGEPVGGARVELAIPGVPAMFMSMNASGGLQKAITSSDGSFRLQVASLQQMGPFGKKMMIFVSHPAFATSRFPLPDNLGDVLELVVGPGNTLRGTVTDSSGRGVPGAILRLRPTVKVDRELAMITAMMPRASGKAYYANQEGEYVIPRLEAGEYDIDVIARGFARKQVQKLLVSRVEQVENFVLDSGGTITGNVIDDGGAPLPGIEVVAIQTPSGGDERPEMREMEQAMLVFNSSGASTGVTDEAGRFELTHLPEGEFSVVARKAGYKPAIVPAVGSGAHLEDMTMLRSASVEGFITDAATGRPIPSFTLMMQKVDPESGELNFDGFNQPRAYNDDEGYFRHDHLDPGKYEIGVSAPGYVFASREIHLGSGEVGAARIALNPGLSLTGVVVEAATGAPIEGAQIHHNFRESREEKNSRLRNRVTRRWGIQQVVTGEDGVFLIEGLEEGKYSINVNHPDYFAEGGEHHREVVLPEGSGEELAFKLHLGGRVEGTLSGLPVVEEEGVNVNFNLQLEMVPEKGIESPEGNGKKKPTRRFTNSTWVNPNTGSYSANSLKPGRYRVSLKMNHWSRDKTPERPRAIEELNSGEPIYIGEVEIEAGRVETLDWRYREP